MRFLVEQPHGDTVHPLMEKVAAVLPAYNEERHLGAAVSAALAAGVGRVIGVDDGSQDATASVLDRLAAADERVIAMHHETNLGKQAAVKTGLGRAVDCDGVELVAVLDADMQNDPAELPRLCAHTSGCDVVIGRRRQDEMPGLRRLANMLANLPYRMLAGLAVTDVQSGFRVYSRPAAAYLARHLPTLGRYALEHTSVLLCARLARQEGRDLRIAEVSVPCPYGTAESHIGVRDNIQLTFAALYYAVSTALLRT